MIIDKNLVLSDAQAVTASAASDSAIDQLAAGGGLKPGARIQFLVDTTAAATGGASNVTFSLQDSADGSSYATILSSVAIAKGTLVAGYVAFEAAMPAQTRRYLRGYYTVDTNDLTSGKFDCRIVDVADKTLDRNL